MNAIISYDEIETRTAKLVYSNQPGQAFHGIVCFISSGFRCPSSMLFTFDHHRPGNHIQTSHLESITFHRNSKVTLTSLVGRFCFGCRFYVFFVHEKNRMFENLVFVLAIIKRFGGKWKRAKCLMKNDPARMK